MQYITSNIIGSLDKVELIDNRILYIYAKRNLTRHLLLQRYSFAFLRAMAGTSRIMKRQLLLRLHHSPVKAMHNSHIIIIITCAGW